MSKLVSLELFFIDGVPDGMHTVRVSNWSGQILVAPRTRLKEMLERDESEKSGVYILLGADVDSGEPLAYIGEAEIISERIIAHQKNKDWWTKAVLITTSTDELDKGRAGYLEARLIQECNKIDNQILENKKVHKIPKLSEASKASMEELIAMLLSVLPTIRVDLFVNKKRPDDTETIEESQIENPVFELTLQLENNIITATAKLENGEFVVQQGSLARGEYIGKRSKSTYYWRLYDRLVELGILVKCKDGDNLIFTENYAFQSTSAAAAVCRGMSSSGPKSWKVEGTEQPYKEWEAESLAGD
jgi:hypothetical protein